MVALSYEHLCPRKRAIALRLDNTKRHLEQQIQNSSVTTEQSRVFDKEHVKMSLMKGCSSPPARRTSLISPTASDSASAAAPPSRPTLVWPRRFLLSPVLHSPRLPSQCISRVNFSPNPRVHKSLREIAPPLPRNLSKDGVRHLFRIGL